MLDKNTFYNTTAPITKICDDGVNIEATVILACTKHLTHEQFATIDEKLLHDIRRTVTEKVRVMVYGDVACALERVASNCSDHNAADSLRSIVAKLAP